LVEFLLVTLRCVKAVPNLGRAVYFIACSLQAAHVSLQCLIARSQIRVRAKNAPGRAYI